MLFDPKSFFKFLSKNRFYTIIDILGFSVSLMFVILIAAYVERELSIDRQQEFYDNIYTIASEDHLGTAIPVGYAMKNEFPEIEKVCPVVFDAGRNATVEYGGETYSADLAFADSSFFSIFSFKVSGGDRRSLMSGTYDAVISSTFARKLFHNEEPVGKSIMLSDSTAVTVTGVMEDIDRSVIPYSDIVCRIERVTEFNSSLSMTSAGNAGSCVAFFKTYEGADLKARENDILDFLKASLWTYKMGFSNELHVLSLDEIYFGEISKCGLNSGDRSFSLILLSVGILILIFAVINYVNLTMAQSGQRAKEMAMRRLLGSSRRELFLSLMTETTLLTVFSFLIAMLFAFIAIPYARDLLQTDFSLDILLSPLWMAGILLIIFFVGLLSGLFPAVMISSCKPVEVVKGSFRRKTKMVFSKVLITFQSVITIMMITASLVMYLQINHMIHAPLGYNTSNIIQVPNVFTSKNDMFYVADRLHSLSSVRNVGYGDGSPASGTNNLSGTYEGRSLSFQQVVVDSTAFDILGFRIKRDNHSSEIGWYLNELAFREMDIPEDSPYFKSNEYNVPVLGVVYDFQLWNVTRNNSPVMLYIGNPHTAWKPGHYLIGVQGNARDAFDDVRKVFEEVSGVPFEGEYIDQIIRRNFDSQLRMAKIIVIFACVAILISILGLIAMSIYFIRQRKQEMSLKKLFGSDNYGVFRLLAGSFLRYVLLAFVIAVPLVWYIMKLWLSSYSYRISLSPWIFISVGIFYLTVSLCAVSFQSWKAANENPVDSIKSE